MEIDDWKMILSFFEWPISRAELLVLGRRWYSMGSLTSKQDILSPINPYKSYWTLVVIGNNQDQFHSQQLGDQLLYIPTWPNPGRLRRAAKVAAMTQQMAERPMTKQIADKPLLGSFLGCQVNFRRGITPLISGLYTLGFQPPLNQWVLV